MKFNKAVNIVFDHEGFYSDDSNDSGGETKFGISQKAYPDLDIKNLTKKHAKFLYEQDYWNSCKCLGLPKTLRLVVFDCAVNQGVHFASKALQKACGAYPDGKIGPMTIERVNLHDEGLVLEKFILLRLDRYMGNSQFERYGKGWLRRLLKVAIQTKEISP